MANPIVDAYLDELAHDLTDLPAAKRKELVGEIRGHIDAALAQLDRPGDADVRNVLERLGDPAEIADEARERFDVKRARAGGLELACVIGLSMLIFVWDFTLFALFGWIVGVILLWWSRVWKARDKFLAMVIYVLALVLGRVGNDTLHRGFWVLILVPPIFLGVRASRARRQ